MSDRENKEIKEIDTDQVVRYLNHAFSKATQGKGKAVRFVNDSGNIETTELYDLQVEFCYMIDNIQRGPKYIIPKEIARANELISSVK